MGNGFNGFEGHDVGFVDILRGDLDGVEQDAGTLGVDACGAEGVGDHGDGDEDGGAVFKDGQAEVVHGLDLGRGLELVEAGVGVAVGLTLESYACALGSAGHDVATLVRHDRHGKTFPCPEGQMTGDR